jgi:hypothetical protein
MDVIDLPEVRKIMQHGRGGEWSGLKNQIK